MQREHKSMTPFALLFLLPLFSPSPVLGDVNCEDLSKDQCAFAVSSASKRCVLESLYRRSRTPTEYECRTSTVDVYRISNHIESDECVRACGVDRAWVGISSDALLEAHFVDKLCSPDCYRGCPNIVDLYYNLAAGEGVFLPDLCRAHRTDPQRAMSALMSSGVARGMSANFNADSPAAAPSGFFSPAASSDPDSGVANPVSSPNDPVPAISPTVSRSPSSAPSRKLLQ